MRASRPVRSAALVAALVVGFVFSAGAHAAPGDLDPTFSGDGKQTTDFQFGVSRAAATVRQPDGKIIAVGSVLRTESGDNTYHDFALARYNPNGTLDTSFSGDGKQTTDFGFGAERARWRSCSSRTARSSPSAHRGFGRLRARPLQPGRLTRHELLRRRQADDRLRGFDAASGVALQADGKIVAVGPSGTDGDFALARYNPNGTLDTSFSGDGKQTTDFGSAAATRQAGSRSSRRQDRRGRPAGGAGDFALARYNPNGSLDTSFSGDGKQTTDFGGGDAANGVAIQGDGKIVAVAARAAAASRLRARPLQPERHRSTRASPATASRRPTSAVPTGATGVAVQGDGKIVAVGSATPSQPATSPSPATTRTARSTRASPATASRRPTSADAERRGDRGGASGRRQDRRGRLRGSRPRRRLRARPLQHRTGRSTRASPATASRRPTSGAATGRGGGGAPGRRQDRRGRRAGGSAATSRSPATTRTARSTRASPATASRRPTSGASTQASGVAIQADGKIVAVGRAGDRQRRLRARPLQPERLARHELLRRRQADDRLRGPRPRRRRGAPGRRQDRRGRRSWRRQQATSRSPATTPTARSTRASPATASRRPTSARLRRRRRTAWRSRRTARSSRSARASRLGTATSRSPATTPTARSTRASPATASRRPTSGATTSARGGAPGRRQDRRGRRHAALAATTSRSPATTRTARSTRASPATASRRPTSGPAMPRTGWRSRASGKIVAVGGGDGSSGRLRARPLQPQRIARHELLGRW